MCEQVTVSSTNFTGKLGVIYQIEQELIILSGLVKSGEHDYMQYEEG